MASSRGLKCIFVALVLTMLNACGGGGGSDDSAGGGSSGGNNLSGTPPPTNSPNVPPSSNDPNAPVAVGAYAYVLNALSDNISSYSINETTGALTEIPGSPFSAGDGPEAIAITPSGRFAYVANPNSESIMAYSIDATTGAITRVGDPVDQSLGRPLFVAMHPSGRAVYVANVRGEWRGGPDPRHHISAFAIDTATGLLSSIATTDLADSPTSISIDPAGKFAYVSVQEDSPYRSFLHVYAIDQTNGTLSEIAGSPFLSGSPFFGGPSQITFEPSGRFAYAPARGGLFGYSVEATTGILSEIAGSPFSGSHWVSVHPSGKFVYGSVAEGVAIGEPNELATFAINDSTGALTAVSSTEWLGQTRLAFSPSGKFVYAPIRTRDDRVYIGRVDPSTGTLTNIGSVGAGALPQAIGITATYR